MTNSAKKYVLENKAEGNRLETQAKLKHYRVDDEFSGLPIEPRSLVLDAGCGTGLVARFLADQWPSARIEACDCSPARLAEAKKLSGANVRYFESNLEKMSSPSQHYDGITCRYVFEHLANPQQAANEFYRSLHRGGWAYLVDLDGLVFNWSPTPPSLEKTLRVLTERLPVDLLAGRKLANYLSVAGFTNIKIAVDKIELRGKDAEAEREMNIQRLTQSLPRIAEALESELEARRFFEAYKRSTAQAGTEFVFSKYKAFGIKP